MPEVSFELPDPGLAEYTWVLFDEHTPLAVPPLGTAIMGRFGAARQDDVPRSLSINGYTYMRRGTGPSGDGPFSNGPLPQSIEDMRRWRTELQPQVDDVVAMLRGFDPSQVRPGAWRETLDAHSNAYWNVFGPIHREAVGPAQTMGRHFRDSYTQRFGMERLADAVGLLQGMPNASLDRASMLWSLSRLVRQDPALAEALKRDDVPPETPAGQAFTDGFQALLVAYGDTSEAALEDLPNWGERPAVPLAAIRAYAGQPDGEGPLDSAARQRARSEALEAELAAVAATGDEAAMELLRLLPLAREMMPNLEDHNYHTDQRLTAASRARWLAIGRYLRDQGKAQVEDDVFYFQRDELIATLEGAPPPDVAELTTRRESLARWRSLPPPPVLGRPLEVDEAPLPPELALRASEVRVLRGVPASPGSYRGRARVINTLFDAEKLQQGDVLVTRVTTPAWTPFFGVVSALVINTGGLLSHASVVAREFGLPAVVGTTVGTVQIPDGATVTVDGTNGLVLIE